MKTITNTLLATLTALALGGSVHAQTQAVLTDLGTTAPTPKTADIAQLDITGNQNAPDGLNYYTDNGANNPSVGEPGQTFTTGSNSAGYSLTAVALRSAGLASVSGTDTAQTYLLHVYSIAGNTATLLATYSADGFTFSDGDWLQWTGLLLHLNPNATYAYSMGRTSAGTGWEDFAVANGNLYAGGEIALIPPAGGSITTGSSHSFDGVFVVGLALPGALTVGLPTVSPGTTVYAGTPLTLSVVASGTAPLQYQWQSDKGTGTFSALANSNTNSLLTSTAALGGLSVQYRVVVTDVTGSVTSGPVAVTVNAASAPIISTDTTPAAATFYTGHTAAFSAAFSGTLPISYQWQVNGGAGLVSIANATNATLVVTNLQAANAGYYSLLASNTVGTASSTAALLTVLTAPAPITSADGYASAVLSDHPIAYWRLNDAAASPTVYDFAGSYDASNSAVLGQPGLRPPSFPGFSSANTAASFDGGTTFVGSNASLMNGLTNFTITGWFAPTGPNTDTRTGLFGQNDVVEFGYNDTDGISVWLPLGGTWVNPKSGPSGFSVGTWSFAALVGDGTNADLYVNGTLRNRQSGGALSSTSTYGFNIGGGGIYDATGNYFLGTIEDVAVFDHALTAGQLQALYGVAVGSVAPTATVTPASAVRYAGRTVHFAATVLNGTAPFTFQWQHAGTNLIDTATVSGSATNQLTVTALSAADAGEYRVIVSNAAGSVTTEPATVSLVSPKAGGYENAVVTLNPVAYWRLNETSDPTSGTAPAYDFFGGLDGTFGSGAEDGFNSIAGPRPADGFNIFETANSALQCGGVANSYVVGPALNLNTDRVTFTFWLKPSGSQSDYCGLVATRTPVGAGVNYTSGDQIGYTWNNNNQNTWSFMSGLVPPQEQWSFVAVAIAPDRATFYLINPSGTQLATNVVTHTSEAFGGPSRIGGDPQDDAGRTYTGTIDEVAVFNTTLTSQQIQDLYKGIASEPPPQVRVTWQQVGSNLVLSWTQGSLEATDALGQSWAPVTNASSPYSLTPAGAKRFFRVKVQ